MNQWTPEQREAFEDLSSNLNKRYRRPGEGRPSSGHRPPKRHGSESSPTGEQRKENVGSNP